MINLILSDVKEENSFRLCIQIDDVGTHYKNKNRIFNIHFKLLHIFLENGEIRKTW